jgi:hypothetical protein
MKKLNVGYLGAGAWGFCLACLLAKKGHKILSWTKDRELAKKLSDFHEHPSLPGQAAHENMRFTTDLKEALEGADLVVEAVTSKGVRHVFEAVGKIAKPMCPIVLTNGKMQADTGTKMIHIGKNTSSTVISKGIAADRSSNSYRGLIKVAPRASGSRNYTQCDSMLVGAECSANTFPYIEVGNASSEVEHEASTSKMNEEQIFYFLSRGLSQEDAINMMVNGFCKEVIRELPLEFATEAQKLLTLKLENSVG